MKNKIAFLILILVGLLASIVFIFALSNVRTEAQTEEELIDFMLLQPYRDAPTNREDLIVYAEKKHDVSRNSISMIDTTKPIRVWVYKDGEISEQMDKQNTIQNYWEDLSSVTLLHSFTYFTIVSISNGGKTAQIAVDYTCGETCGMGMILTVERNSSGDWKIIDSEIVWVS